jgi:hypothetical protein
VARLAAKLTRLASYTLKIPGPGYFRIAPVRVPLRGMRNRGLKEALSHFVMPVFFGGGLLLTKEFMSVDSAWDYVVLQLLTLMNGLGLGIVLVLWVMALRKNKV